MTDKSNFLVKMTIAYMQNHGHAPAGSQLENWSELYILLQRKGR